MQFEIDVDQNDSRLTGSEIGLLREDSADLLSAFPRRKFCVAALSLLCTSALPALAVGVDVAFSQTDLAIANLGKFFRVSQEAEANRLEALAREALGLAASADIDFDAARRAQMFLTEPRRIAGELEKGQVVFVDGWLLTYSEAGTALLFSAALAHTGPQKATPLIK